VPRRWRRVDEFFIFPKLKQEIVAVKADAMEH
jgi:hypothetical protein